MSENNRVCIVSLRCAPGLQKEIDALGAGFSRSGWAVTQLLAEDYRAFRPEAPGIHFVPLRRGYLGMLGDICAEVSGVKVGRLLFELRPNLVLFYNQSPLNLLVTRLCRRKPSCRLGVFLHDPWKSRKYAHGASFAITYSFVEWLQKQMVRRCEHVVTLSAYGTSLVVCHYPGSRYKIIEGRILLHDDGFNSVTSRSVVSIIGRINPSTGHDEFLALAENLRPLLPEVAFEIVTSSRRATDADFVGRAAKAGVGIVFKPVLSESEIESAIRRSICVFRLDSELTQSGVIPLCYRLGTPVVVRDIEGLAQHVIEGKTGYLLKVGTTAAQLAGSISEIQKSKKRFESDCRAAFMREWAQSAFERYYAELARPGRLPA